MRRDEFESRSPGSLTELTVTIRDGLSGELEDITVPSFVPAPLPSEMKVSPGVVRLMEEAMHQLGSLNELAKQSPFGNRLVRPFVRLEAVSSSRIEGTISTYEDLVRFEQLTMFDHGASGRGDEAEVLAYVRALEFIWSQPGERGTSLSFIREIHQILMAPSNEFLTDPGRFRRRPVFIGGRTIEKAAFVPPPPALVPELMADLETALRKNRTIPRLVMIAIAHYQFETIHPFNDGNGRTGRLLILQQLRSAGLLSVPTLHLSRTIEATKETYIDLLTRVRLKGAWDDWIEYFVDLVSHEAARSIRLVSEMSRIYEASLPVLTSARGDLAQRALVSIITEPVFSVSSLARSLGVQFNSAKRIVQLLEQAGMVRQTSDGHRNRRYSAPEVVRAYER